MRWGERAVVRSRDRVRLERALDQWLHDLVTPCPPGVYLRFEGAVVTGGSATIVPRSTLADDATAERALADHAPVFLDARRLFLTVVGDDLLVAPDNGRAPIPVTRLLAPTVDGAGRPLDRSTLARAAARHLGSLAGGSGRDRVEVAVALARRTVSADGDRVTGLDLSG